MKENLTKELVLAELKHVNDPEIKRDIVSLNMVEEITIKGRSVSVMIKLTTPACPLKHVFQEQVSGRLKQAFGDDLQVKVTFSSKTVSLAPPDLTGIDNIILVGSGKGGVGKSTVAANIAVALAGTGVKVGLLDADLYGPSMGIMMGIKGQELKLNEKENIIPLEAHGVKVLSMGNLIKDTDAVIWRGPLLHKTLEQFLKRVEWGELDFLIIDLPPGTGDIQISLSQMVTVAGAVVVTTPQSVAFADVLRAVKMFEKLKIPVLGLIENMSWFLCPDNDKKYHIFGEGKIAEYAKQYSLRQLGQLPIVPELAELSDAGVPYVALNKEDDLTASYLDLAKKVAGFTMMEKIRRSGGCSGCSH